MSERKRFLLRIDERLYAALERWAADEMRSVNGQMEFLLTDAARRAGRLGKAARLPEPKTAADEDPASQEEAR
jgi:hypothetical protein